MLSTYTRSFQIVNGLSLLTFNTLAHGYFTKQSFPKIQPISFEIRFPILIEMIKKYNASIVCLQQIDMPEKWTQQCKKLGYQIYYNAINKKTTLNTNQGILICIKKQYFQVNNYENKQYNSQLNQYWFFQLFNFKTKNKLFFYGTHLKSKVFNQQIRIKQSLQLIEHIKLKNSYFPQIPIVLVGDLNCQPTYQSLLMIQKLQLQNNQKLQSVYNKQSDWTTFKIRNTIQLRMIDYIFYKGLQLIGYQKTPNIQEFKKNNVEGLPTLLNPSDHLPLFAVFSF